MKCLHDPFFLCEKITYIRVLFINSTCIMISLYIQLNLTRLFMLAGSIASFLSIVSYIVSWWKFFKNWNKSLKFYKNFSHLFFLHLSRSKRGGAGVDACSGPWALGHFTSPSSALPPSVLHYNGRLSS